MTDILINMAGNLFDVFVVGATDPSPAGETRLAAALSAKHGVPLATVAKAISAKNLRAGQGLEQPQAQALVRHLQSIGAVTVIRTAAGAKAAGASQGPAAPRGPSTQAPTQRATKPSPSAGGWPSTPSPASTAAEQFPHLAAPLQPASAVGKGPDPFQPRFATPVLATRSAGPAAKASPTPSPSPGSGLTVEASPGPKLELAREKRGPASDEDEPPIPTRDRVPAPSVSASSLREVGMRGASGVSMDEDPRNLNLVRCVQHGLYYDKTKASGCRKCMSPAREVASKMAAEAEAKVAHVGNLRSKPAKRAFMGLGLALILGFIPAAYYCFGPGSAKARELRVEQELLGRQPGTEQVIKQFDSIDLQVNEQHEAATRNTAIVWIAITSVSLLGWYKIT